MEELHEQGGGLFSWLRPEWAVIAAAPRAFGVSVLALTFLFSGGIYLFFDKNLQLKNDLIQSLSEREKELNDRLAQAQKQQMTLESKREESRTDYNDDFFDQPLETIKHHEYRNEAVHIDGKHFVDCVFINVTFRFLGKKPFEFASNTRFEGTIALETDHPATKLFSAFAAYLGRRGDAGSTLGGPRDKKTGRFDGKRMP